MNAVPHAVALRRRSLVASALACVFAAAPAMAQIPGNTVRLGVLTDMSGNYAGMGGKGSVVAANMAIEDCLKAECKGLKIELLSADHQNKADVAAAKAREWIDRNKVNALADLTNSAAALAIQKLALDKGVIALYSGPATTRLTNEDCSPNGFHWMFDTYSQAVGTAAALTRLGQKSWYFVTVDYAFGQSLEQDAGEVVKKLGGNVVGRIRYPLNTNDFSSYLMQAQASKAQVIGLASGGQDTVNAIKQAREFGVGNSQNQRLAALLLFLSDVHALGLKTAQGLTFADGFYWDFDERTRAFSKRFEARFSGNKPTMVQAGVYSSVYHYLKAVAASQ
ncbi:MAG: ABC transporter substrate-binding protein, partial [Microvirgula sp.]